ncbi:uncharacterized protein LOC130673498 [Microplitis mediator]|uniref:uncharacterized protein LOC130673498 n=1 Tax=Microplitis mediator TaxID=375433 RepID=UPI0025542156|nr:uncharacterized protein LOC130673498 [Microplitis mediator]
MFIKFAWIVSALIILEVHFNSKVQVQSHRISGRVLRNPLRPPFRNIDSKSAIYRDHIDRNYIDHRPYPSLYSHYRLIKPYGIFKQRRFPGIPAVFLKPPGAKPRTKNSRPNKLKSRPKKPRDSKEKLSSEDEEKIREIKYIRDHAPAQQTINEVRDEDEEYDDDDDDEVKSYSDEDRVDFHVHGHRGPDSYIFGYDTGKGKNRQFRLEEKHGNGTVTGSYGYYDAKGKLRKIYYNADPSYGYQQKSVNDKNNEATNK